MKSRALLRCLGVAALVTLSACASQDTAQLINAQQAALIKATCQNVMHIGYHNAVDLSACMGSLSDTLAAKMQGDIARKSYETCAGLGLARDTPEFSMCVLDRQKNYAAELSQNNVVLKTSPVQPVKLAYDAQKDGSEDYYDASFDTKRRREEYSCAQLGLDPISSAFGQCVADLNASLFNADNPNP